MRAVDWIARTVMLVLASLATLALIGSLSTLSHSTIGRAFPGGVERAEMASDDGGAASPVSASEALPAPETTDVKATARPNSDTSPGGGAEIARWLKALTYAVLALAGFAAAGVVALVRIAGHLDRATLR